MNPAGARGLIPPRPNLGPEPLSEAQPIASPLWVAAILACPLIVWLVWKRLGFKRVGKVGRDLSIHDPRDATPRGQLVAQSDSIRDLLADRFGPAWRAKTTEELSAEPRLGEVLGCDQLQELIWFFDQVDQLKFAPERSNHQQESLERELVRWEPRLVDLKKTLRAQPEGRAKIRAIDSGEPRSKLSRRLAHHVALVEPHAQNVGLERANP